MSFGMISSNHDVKQKAKWSYMDTGSSIASIKQDIYRDISKDVNKNVSVIYMCLYCGIMV